MSSATSAAAHQGRSLLWRAPVTEPKYSSIADAARAQRRSRQSTRFGSRTATDFRDPRKWSDSRQAEKSSGSRPSWHRLRPLHVPLEAQCCCYGAVAIPLLFRHTTLLVQGSEHGPAVTVAIALKCAASTDAHAFLATAQGGIRPRRE